RLLRRLEPHLAEELAHRDERLGASRADEPLARERHEELFPGVALVALLGSLSGGLGELGGLEVPALALAVAGDGLGPQLATCRPQALDVDAADLHRPPAPRAGR